MQNLYQLCYDLINTYIFNSTLEAGSIEHMFTIFFSLFVTFGCLFLPFFVMFKIFVKVFKL